jgi:single-strand DNA-binding protein
MDAFTLTAVGHLARDPELETKGDKTFARFCLVGNDYAGKDAQGDARQVTTGVWFVAFNSLGEAISKNARKGDQLILQARIRANNWTDKDGEKHYGHSFQVTSFKFGAPGAAKRRELTASQQGQPESRDEAATAIDDAVPF